MKSFTPSLTTFVVMIVVGVRYIAIINCDRPSSESMEELPVNRPYTYADLLVAEIDESGGPIPAPSPMRWGDTTQLGRTGGRLEAYTSEIESKMHGIESPDDFLHILFPNGNLDNIWNDIVNSSFYQVGTRSGRYRDPTLRDIFREDEYSEITSEKLREALTNHTQQVSCLRPKPVLIDMYKELNITRDRPIYILPECTMLNRCHNGECCRREGPCVPREGTREAVTRSFMITEIKLQSHPNEVLEPSPRIRLFNYTFYQDTICDCLGPTRQPTCDLTCNDVNKKLNTKRCQCECLKRCATPYVLDEDTCTCDCTDSDNDCKKVKRGKRLIKPRECSCITSGKCYTPPCKRGLVFSAPLCRCVESKRANKSSKRRRVTSRGRFGGGEEVDEESISESRPDCITESPGQSIADKDVTNVGMTRGRMGVASLRTVKPLCVDNDSSSPEEIEDNGSEAEETSGYIPPF